LSVKRSSEQDNDGSPERTMNLLFQLFSRVYHIIHFSVKVNDHDLMAAYALSSLSFTPSILAIYVPVENTIFESYADAVYNTY
jgi:hypothetical protein